MSDESEECPNCSSYDVAEILYQEPTFLNIEEEKRGRIYIKGTYAKEDSPKWHCNSCGHNWGNVCQNRRKK